MSVERRKGRGHSDVIGDLFENDFECENRKRTKIYKRVTRNGYMISAQNSRRNVERQSKFEQEVSCVPFKLLPVSFM